MTAAMAVFYFQQEALNRDMLHSFPTRRSSDLVVKLRPRQRIADADSDFVGHRLAHQPHRGQDVLEGLPGVAELKEEAGLEDRKSTRLNSSHSQISYAVFCLKKKTRPLSPSSTR